MSGYQIIVVPALKSFSLILQYEGIGSTILAEGLSEQEASVVSKRFNSYEALKSEIDKLKAERDELIRILKVVETAIRHDRSYQNTHRTLISILNDINP